MKILALILLLLAAAWTGSQGKSFRSSKSDCCPEGMLRRKKIHESMIQGYRYTSPNCTHRAALVELPKKEGKIREVCVDPEEKWFQDYLRKQEKQKKQKKEKKQKKPNTTSM